MEFKNTWLIIIKAKMEDKGIKEMEQTENKLQHGRI